MPRPGAELEDNARLVALQKMSRTPYPLQWLEHFVTEWEYAVELIRTAAKKGECE